MQAISEKAMDARARRAAKRVGLFATKSRWHGFSLDNHGHFMLVDPSSNSVVGGQRFDMTAEEVIESCRE